MVYQWEGESMGFPEKDIKLMIDGMGIVMYSPKTVEGIESGYNYLKNEYTEPQQVAEHILKGDMVGFCTGTGGYFTLKIRNGYPAENEYEKYSVGIRLGIEVRDETICFIDLFWLSEWEDDFCPPKQRIHIPNGYYHVTILTRKPKSGIWGDNQEICVYLNPLNEMPELKWNGVPMLFT